MFHFDTPPRRLAAVGAVPVKSAPAWIAATFAADTKEAGSSALAISGSASERAVSRGRGVSWSFGPERSTICLPKVTPPALKRVTAAPLNPTTIDLLPTVSVRKARYVQTGV